MYKIAVTSSQCKNFIRHVLCKKPTFMSFSEIIESILKDEPNSIKLIVEIRGPESHVSTIARVKSFYLEFESEDDFIAFVLRWS